MREPKFLDETAIASLQSKLEVAVDKVNLLVIANKAETLGRMEFELADKLLSMISGLLELSTDCLFTIRKLQADNAELKNKSVRKRHENH